MRSHFAHRPSAISCVDLHRAVVRNELRLVYQPKFDLAANRVVGAEALLRWQHPVLGLLGPDRFIALAEQFGMIQDIGYWVLRQACAQLRLWHDAGMTCWQIAVNVSPVQLSQPGFYVSVCQALAVSRIRADVLTLEITETSAIEPLEASRRLLRGLSDLGVKISLDDFGTGFSNLDRLLSVPAHEIKLPRELIGNIDRNTVELQLVTAVISMAHAIGVSVVAEGVERADQLARLRALDCGQSQGYLHGRPVGGSHFLHLHGENSARNHVAVQGDMEALHF